MKDRLTALFNEWGLHQYIPYQTEREMLIDYLLTNGVIVPPCKEGDKVYKLMPKCTVTIEWCPYNGGYGTARCDKEPCEAYVKEICFSLTDIKYIGKTIFLTKEEAERKLAEVKNGTT